MTSKHIGSSFDDFLKEEGIYEEATAHALKRVLAGQIGEAMKDPGPHQDGHGAAHENQPRPA